MLVDEHRHDLSPEGGSVPHLEKRKFATCVVPSPSVTISWRHVFAQDRSVFQTYVYRSASAS
jgi:hypothetical protein